MKGGVGGKKKKKYQQQQKPSTLNTSSDSGKAGVMEGWDPATKALRHDEDVQWYTKQVVSQQKNRWRVQTTTISASPRACRYPSAAGFHLTFWSKKDHEHWFFFGHVGKAYHGLPSEVDEESSHDLSHCLTSTSYRLQHISCNSQLAKASVFIRPRRGHLPSPNTVFLVYKLCGPSILRNSLRKLAQKSNSYWQDFRKQNPRPLLDR